MSEADVLAQINVPLAAQPGLICVVDQIPTCDFCGLSRAGLFDFATRYGPWAHGCLECYVEHRASPRLGVGVAQLWITIDQVGAAHLPRG